VNHHGPIAGIAASGPFIATAGYDNQLILWDASSKRPLARSLHDHLINNCAFNARGTMVATASSDYSARLWEVPSLRLKAALIGHEDDVDMAVFSPDDSLVATCALDRTVRIFDTAGHCRKILRGHTGNILSVAWTCDGGRLVSSSVDGTVREWDAITGDELRCTELSVRTDSLVIDAAGRIIAGDDQGRIAIIVAGDMSFIRAHEAGIKKIAYDETDGILVTLSYDRTLAIWALIGDRRAQEVARTALPAAVWARAAVMIAPGRVAVGTFGSSFCVYDWATNCWDMSGVVPGNALNAVASVGGTRYAIGDSGTLREDGVPSTQLGSLCNFLLPVGGHLFSGGQLGSLFDARTGELLYQHYSPLNCATSFVRGGQRHLAVGTYTGDALIFATATSGQIELVEQLKIYSSAIKGIVASNDRIFSVCASTEIAWHEISSLDLVRRVPNAHERIVNGCCLAGANGFASIGRDLKLRIWTDDADEVYQTPHPNSVKCIASSNDRNTLMTGAYTGTIAGFDMATRSWTSFNRLTSSGISALAYERETGRFLASSYDGRIYEIE